MNPVKLDTGEELDPKALVMMRAIRQKESGGKYDAVGDVGTSTGAFQFQPNTWKGYAKDVLGDENAEMNKANQNKVAYTKIKSWVDEGRSPEEIAASWNAPATVKNVTWKTHKGTTTINGQEVQYDTPKYVSEVMEYAKKYGKEHKESQGINQNTQAAPLVNPVTPEPKLQENTLLDNPVTRGIQKFGNFLTFGGASQLGNQAGGSLAYLKEKGKGLLGGKDNSEYVPESSFKDTVTGAGKVVGGTLLAAGSGLLGDMARGSNILKAKEIAYNIPMEISQFNKLGKIEKLNVLGNALKTAEAGDRTILIKAMQYLAPEKASLFERLSKGAWDAAKNYVIFQALGNQAGGIINSIRK